MSNTARDVHIDQPLSNVAIGYTPQELIAPSISPIVTVGKQSDHYIISSRADMLRLENDKRAPGTYANRITRGTSSETYYAENYALMYPVTDEDRENRDAVFMQSQYNDNIEYTTHKLLLGWENRIAAKVTNTSNVGSSAAVSSAWNDYNNSDPLGDVESAIDNIHDTTGVRPNQVTFAEQAWRSVKRNVDLRNLVNGTNNGGGYVTREQLAKVLEVDKINIGGAYKNTGNEAQEEVLTTVWGDNVLISYTVESPSLVKPSFMYSFRWVKGRIPNMQAIRHAYDTKAHAEDIEVGYYQDEKITAAEYSYLLVGVNSSQ